MNWKSLISGAGAAILGAAALVAEAPPELQKQLPQLFPENERGYITLILGFCAYLAHRYSARHATLALIAAAAPEPPGEPPSGPPVSQASTQPGPLLQSGGFPQPPKPL